MSYPAAERSVVGYRVYRIGKGEVERLTPEPIRNTSFTHADTDRARFAVASVDALGQEGQPSSSAWCGQSYEGFYEGPWHQ